jgi:hypothetical protein
LFWKIEDRETQTHAIVERFLRRIEDSETSKNTHRPLLSNYGRIGTVKTKNTHAIVERSSWEKGTVETSKNTHSIVERFRENRGR